MRNDDAELSQETPATLTDYLKSEGSLLGNIGVASLEEAKVVKPSKPWYKSTPFFIGLGSVLALLLLCCCLKSLSSKKRSSSDLPKKKGGVRGGLQLATTTEKKVAPASNGQANGQNHAYGGPELSRTEVPPQNMQVTQQMLNPGILPPVLLPAVAQQAPLSYMPPVQQQQPNYQYQQLATNVAVAPASYMPPVQQTVSVSPAPAAVAYQPVPTTTAMSYTPAVSPQATTSLLPMSGGLSPTRQW